ncbi:MAG: SOS response-associated peptidase family protein, partial [Planctomycetota bacterium]
GRRPLQCPLGCGRRPRYAILRADADGPVSVPARWGWQRSLARRGLTLERDDRLGASGLWRPAAASRRCLMPAQAWHERTGAKGSRQRWSLRPRRGAFTLAGLWKTTPAGEAFAIVTTAAHPRIPHLHDRMPVTLGPEPAGAWRDPDRGWAAAPTDTGAADSTCCATADANN